MKKIIGIPGYIHGGDSRSYGVGTDYLEFASRFGNPRIIMPWENHVEVDLLLIAGGMDISPSTYGEIPGFNTSNQDVFKEHFYKNQLGQYVESQTPIFGVCLGFQMLAVYFGSKLKQHLLFHENSDKRWEKGHDVYSTKWLGVPKVPKAALIDVNSHHHQAVLLSEISDQLSPLYVADYEDDILINGNNKDKIVEAFKHKELPISGVQWHPEQYYDQISTKLIKELLVLKDKEVNV